MAIIRSGQLIGVCIHHSAVEPGANNITELKARASSYNISHSKKSWAETIKTPGEFGYPYIEYHYMIAKDGSLLQVQDEKYVLYHAGDNIRGVNSFNLHGIAIMIDGNYENEVPNDNQKLTVVKLIRDIQSRYKIDAMVRGHKETSETSTSCPGKNIGIHTSGWMKSVIDSINDTTYPQTPATPLEALEMQKLREQVNTLQSKLDELTGQLADARGQIKTLSKSEVEKIEQISSLTNEANTEREQHKFYEEQYMKVSTELNDLKRKNQFTLLLEQVWGIFQKLWKLFKK